MRAAKWVAGGVLGAVLLAAGVFRVWLFDDNLHVVLRGEVHRSAQLDPERLDDLVDELGLRSIVNLRGGHGDSEWYRAQQRVVEARGLRFHDLRLSALRLPARADLLRLIEILETAPRPLLVHCLRGTDRSGLAAALAVLLGGGDLDAAREQYDLSHGYVAGLSLSDLPEVIDAYEAWLAARESEHAPGLVSRFAREGYTPYFYRAAIEVADPPVAVSGESPSTLHFRVTNRSSQPWKLTPAGGAGVHLGLRVIALDPGPPFALELRGETPRRSVAPGETIALVAQIPALPRAGRYRLLVDLVDEEVTWFSEMGSVPLDLELAVPAVGHEG